ncbi:MAG: hypothetical protein WCY32_01685 [Burkholderiaceae bacterium]
MQTPPSSPASRGVDRLGTGRLGIGRRGIVRTVLRSAKGRAVLGAIVLYLCWQLWLSLAAPGKISPEIDRSQTRVNLLVYLPFVPERFHVLTFQKYGRVSGTTDDSIELRGVRPDSLNAIARYYWVARVAPLPPDQ